MALETGDYLNDLVISNPVGSTDPKSQGDNHLRLIKTTLKQTFPGMAGRAWRVQDKSDTYNLATTDNMTILRFTGTDKTLNLLAGATAGNGFFVIVYASADDVTLDAAGADTINGAGTFDIPEGWAAWLFCAGGNWHAFLIPAGVRHLQWLSFAAADQTNAVTETAEAAITFRLPACQILTIRGGLKTPSGTGAFVMDVNDDGSSIFGVDKLTVDEDEKTSTTSAAPASFDGHEVADDSEMTVDYTDIGDGAAVGPSVYLLVAFR